MLQFNVSFLPRSRYVTKLTDVSKMRDSIPIERRPRNMLLLEYILNRVRKHSLRSQCATDAGFGFVPYTDVRKIVGSQPIGSFC